MEDLFLHKALLMHIRDVPHFHAVQSCQVGMYKLHEDTFNRRKAPAYPCSKDCPSLLSCRNLYCAMTLLMPVTAGICTRGGERQSGIAIAAGEG